MNGIEIVRRRPGLYIGSTTGDSGPQQMVFEVIENAVNEARAGYADQLEVTLNKGDSCVVYDNGRGIPTRVLTTQGVSFAEAVMTELHATGGFGQHQVQGALHGVGLCVVNALSEWLELRIWRDGSEHFMRFDRGHPKTRLRRVDQAAAQVATDRLGTQIEFKPDGEIFADWSFGFEAIEKRLRELVCLASGLTITLIDRRGPQTRKSTVSHDKR